MSAPGGNNFQPESLNELARFVQYMFSSFDKSLNELSSKLDKLDVVSREQHRSDLQHIKDELNEQKQELADYQSRLANYGRWFVSSLVLPLVGLIITVYGLLNGSN